MSVPVKRHTSGRGKRRRSGAKVNLKRGLSACPKCKASVIPHRACIVCGTYKGKNVVTTKLDKKTLKKQEKTRAKAQAK